MNKKINLMMIAVAAVVLVAVNVGVLVAGNNGSIAPVENMVLWGAFFVLNIASIVWGVSLLGLQPIVVAVSYVLGGILAYVGVRNEFNVSTAEIITAGATYGAFGALVAGNAMQKVRLSFFNKAQVPFVFIIVGLLGVDAGLNSGVSSASPKVLVSAVAIPFVGAGVVLGAIWSVLNRFGIGRKPSEVLGEVQAVAEVKAADVERPATTELKKPARKKSAPAKMPAPAKKAEPVPVAEPVVAEAKPEPKVEEPAPVKVEEEFVPLAIDEQDNVAAVAVEEEKDDAPFEIPTFDASLYSSGSKEEKDDGDVMVQEPKTSVDVDFDAIASVLGSDEPKTDAAKPEAAGENKGDWLGGHLDLLNKIK
jgi:hypothetical protein